MCHVQLTDSRPFRLVLGSRDGGSLTLLTGGFNRENRRAAPRRNRPICIALRSLSGSLSITGCRRVAHQRIQRTPNTVSATIQHVGVDHRHAHVAQLGRRSGLVQLRSLPSDDDAIVLDACATEDTVRSLKMEVT